MSTQGYATDISLEAAADLRTKQFYGIKIDSNGKAALAGAGEAVGVLQNNPNTGEQATVRIFGKSKMVASASITTGSRVASDSNGKMKAVVAGRTDTSDGGVAADPLLGSLCLGVVTGGAGADADIAEVMILQMGAVPTTLS